MIALDLECINGHLFEGWFKDEKSFKRQKRKGQVICPSCNETEVNRLPSSFGIMKTAREKKGRITNQKMAVANINKQIVDFVEKNFDNVGSDFTSEALKIHYGTSEPRNIRGVSSNEEEKLLKKEGVPIFKFPLPVKPETDS